MTFILYYHIITNKQSKVSMLTWKSDEGGKRVSVYYNIAKLFQYGIIRLGN